MKRQQVLANAILWAAAIMASAALGASPFLSLVLLPLLATMSVVTAGRDTCFKRSEQS
ncbi:hypothetical protein [Rhodanobacter ginsengiterrae]|uniref:hypothetical protein n=1 Tax=Rhodanobacter ginsengiterrae TaxID=2008451 RepID=UPI003CF47781